MISAAAVAVVGADSFLEQIGHALFTGRRTIEAKHAGPGVAVG
jgi:hypothetical protein